MASSQTLSYISNKVPFFRKEEKKRVFLEIIGALVLRIISLRKAAEILDMDEEVLLEILESIEYPFSYLETEDIVREKEWKI